MINLGVEGHISLIFNKIAKNEDIIDLIQQAGAYSIVEENYVRESPVLTASLRQEVKTTTTLLGFQTWTTSKKNGKPYPILLHEGTGRLRGARDYGFTYGRVNAGEVAWGIGGIRPNKFALRGKKKSEKPLGQYMSKMIKNLAEQKIKI